MNRHPVSNQPADPCQRVTYVWDYPYFYNPLNYTTAATIGRLAQASWGSTDAACGAKAFAEQYAYTMAGLPAARRLLMTVGSSSGQASW